MIVRDIFNICNIENVIKIIDEKYLSEKSKKDPEETKEKLISIINEIQNTDCNEHPETMCCVIKYWDTYGDNIVEYFDVCSVEIKDLDGFTGIDKVEDFKDLKMKPFEEYCFMSEDRKDILGYHLNKTSIKKYGVDEVAAAIFWELTWFGYSYKEQNENRINFNKSLDNKEDIIDFDDLEEDDEFDIDLNKDLYEISKIDKELAVKSYNEEAEYWNMYLEDIKFEK